MVRRGKKIIAMIFVLVLTVILTVAGTVIAFGTENQSGMDVQFKSGGKTQISLTVSQEKVSDYGVTDLDSFKELFSLYLKALNAKENDIVVVDEYSAFDGGYKVKISTRRINKIKGIGEISYHAGSAFSTDIEKMDIIEEYYNGVSGSVSILNEKGEQVSLDNFKIKGLTLSANKVNGNKQTEEVDYKQFKSYLSSTDDQMTMFQLSAFKFADEITLHINGKIKYVTSDSIELVDESTVKLLPLKYTVKGKTSHVYVGYFTYKENLSPFAIGAIIFGGVALAVLVFCFIKFKWISRFWKSNLRKEIIKYRLLYLMILPGFVVLFLFHYLPMAGLVTAFQSYNLLDGYSSEFIGLKNFYNILYAVKSDKMYQIFRNTIFISIIRIGTNFPVILMLALVVNSIKSKAIKGVFQSISFIPYFISWAAVGGMAFALLDSNGGLINNLLKTFGLEPVSWFSTPDPWWMILAITSLWKGMGWGTLIYISAMCNIDSELYEACAIDGGGVLRQAFTVTIPAIMSVICLQLILDTGNIMKDNYEQILALIPNTTGLNTTVEVVGKYTVSQIGTEGMGSATAMGLIQSLIGVILVLTTNSIIKKTENEGIL